MYSTAHMSRRGPVKGAGYNSARDHFVSAGDHSLHISQGRLDRGVIALSSSIDGPCRYLAVNAVTDRTSSSRMYSVTPWISRSGPHSLECFRNRKSKTHCHVA